MTYKVVQYGVKQVQAGFAQKRDEVASFNDPVRAEEYARTLTNMQKQDEFGGKVYFKVEEVPDTSPLYVQAIAIPIDKKGDASNKQSVFESWKPLTIKDAIEQAIKEAGGRAELDRIYATVRRLKKLRSKTPNESIRTELYRGIPKRFQRNPDGTYGLATPGSPARFVSASSGIIINQVPLALYSPTEADLEKAFTQNYRAIFGAGALYIPIKKLLGSTLRRVTDGLLLDLNDPSHPKFRIVELELSKHPLAHIRDQVTDFIVALSEDENLTKLVPVVHEYIEARSEADKDISDWYQFLIDGFTGTGVESFQYIHDLLHRKNSGVVVVIDRKTPQLEKIAGLVPKASSVEIVEFKVYRTSGLEIYWFSRSDVKRLS